MNNAKIIGISGRMGSGKSELAKNLLLLAKEDQYGFIFLNTQKFAEPLYTLHEYILNKMEGFTGKARVMKDGDLLQWLGTEYGRTKFGENVWAEICRKKVNSFSTSSSKTLIVIDDMRFENEFDIFPDAYRIRLECSEETRKIRCDMWRDKSNHPSETGLDAYAAAGKFDMTYNTDVGGMASLDIARAILNTIEELNGKTISA